MRRRTALRGARPARKRVYRRITAARGRFYKGVTKGVAKGVTKGVAKRFLKRVAKRVVKRGVASADMTGKDAMHWRHEGAVDGAAWRSAHPDGTLEALSDYAQRTWAEKANRHAEAGAAGRMRFYRYGPAYAAGIRQGTGMAMQRELLPLQGSASAVLYANGRAAPLQAVLAELERLPLQEIVVVLGADAEPVLETLLSHPRIVVVHSPAGYESPHAARAAGARLTGADTVLFADGAKLCPARLLGALLVRTDAGTDAALSDRTSHEGSFDRRGEASWLREFLNVSLGRPDLRADAIGGVPFALSRRAIDAIGTEALGIPARAQAAALVLGLRVSVCDGVPFSGERDVPVSAGSDHTAAWRDCLSMRGARLGFPDHKRNRQAIGGGGLVTDDSGYPQL